MTEPATGGCLCGAIRYAVLGAPRSLSVCHCRTCRRSAGAPSVAWAVLALRDFRITRGTPAVFLSSPGIERGHCAACGTSLTFREVGEETIDITLASLDDAERFVPNREIWLSHRLAWEATDAGRRGFERGSSGG